MLQNMKSFHEIKILSLLFYFGNDFHKHPEVSSWLLLFCGNNNKIFENKGKINTESIEKQTEKKDNNGSHEKEINKNSNSSKNGDSENIQYVSKEIPLISEFSKFNQKRNDDYSNILENNPESLFDSITPETVSKWLEILEIKTKKPITIISKI